MRCTCGHPDDYNFSIDNGLCNSCIAEKLDQLETELDNHRWIPVEERLPSGKDKGYILRGSTKTGACSAVYWANTNWESEQLKTYYTHWKPISVPEKDKP